MLDTSSVNLSSRRAERSPHDPRHRPLGSTKAKITFGPCPPSLRAPRNVRYAPPPQPSPSPAHQASRGIHFCCGLAIPAPTCLQDDRPFLRRHPNWDIISTVRHSMYDHSKIDSTSPVAAGYPVALGRHFRSSLNLFRDGISPSGCHITKETTGGVAQPMGPPISSSQLPVSDIPCSDLRDKDRVHTRLRNCPLRSLVVVAFPETPPRRRPSPSGIDPEV
ncbi:hypothetical protein D9611_012983 [Ephemerocybe angulata]|uniref:Uncharacterized protein n=1 Tax=Ephemerocybe angulata TaxID=980116 RepID=A0A8H5ESW8_9AGAR|nr:hypothetical protein D9611_012983 [Tulosesus angulatus]